MPVGREASRLNCRILLVEERPDTERTLATSLTRAGADVVLECNTEAAVDLVFSTKPDHCAPQAVVMDLKAPGPAGTVAARMLRERGFQGPIVLLSRLDRPQDREQCIEAGCSAYLVKPIDQHAVIETLSNLLPESG